MFRHFEGLLLLDRNVVAVNGSWMEWNLFLAAIPIALAWLLFAPGRKRGPLWWLGLTVFVSFLPNSAYVLTDVVHLGQEVHRYDRPALFGAVLPLFGAYFTVGFACYASALVRLRRYLLTTATARAATVAEISLHLLVAVGVFLGRVDRLNSWDILTQPHSVLAAMANLAHGPAAVALAVLAGVVVGTKAVFVWIGQAARSSLRWAWVAATGASR